jgi:NADPH:quinone reductase-like Zn-dependent oxidoreductase
MKAVFIRRFGGNEVLEIGERPRPRLRQREVLVRIRAAAVNPRDWMVRSGTYPFRFTLPRFPIVLGGDFAGEIAAIGPGVRRFGIGEDVYGMQRAFGGFGAFAQFIAVRESVLARIPADLAVEQAAAVPLAALTAWQGLHADARLVQGERVLVNGAAGGVGSFAVQFAAAAGAKVSGVCSARNLGFVRDLGADEVIDYARRSFTEGGRQWDVIYDAIGRASWASCRSLLRPGGRYITTVPKRTDVAASLLTALPAALLPGRRYCRLVLVRSDGRELEAISKLIEAGRVRVHVEEVFPLESVARALDRSRTFHTRGKLVVRVP